MHEAGGIHVTYSSVDMIDTMTQNNLRRKEALFSYFFIFSQFPEGVDVSHGGEGMVVRAGC